MESGAYPEMLHAFYIKYTIIPHMYDLEHSKCVVYKLVNTKFNSMVH